jgi:hypothetical protein
VETCLEKAHASPEKTKAGLKEVTATDLETRPETPEAVMEQQEFRNEEMNVDTIETLEDRHGDGHLAARHRREPMKRTQGNVGFRKTLAACTAQGKYSKGNRQGKLSKRIPESKCYYSITNSVASARERTMLTERLRLVGEVSANFCG